jgi:hypothetical protein
MLAILAPFCNWLAATLPSKVIQTTGWIIPTLQTIHILAIAALFSSAVLVDLRLWRLFDRDVALKDVAQRFLPVIWPVLLVLLTTGTLLIVGEPRRALLNTTFYLKMALLACAVLITIGLQWSLSVDPNFWDKDRSRKVAGRFAATVSILIWAGVIFAGRWIAYSEVG